MVYIPYTPGLELTHCGLITPYRINELGHYWYRLRLGAWVYQAITRSNAAVSSIGPMQYIWVEFCAKYKHCHHVFIRKCSQQNGGHFVWASITFRYYMNQQLHWRHKGIMASEVTGISTVFNSFFKLTTKKISRYHISGFCEGNSWAIKEFPSQRGQSCGKCVHVYCLTGSFSTQSITNANGFSWDFVPIG